MTNPYLEGTIQTRCAENDHMVLNDINVRMVGFIEQLQKLIHDGALAYKKETFVELVDKLDDAQAKIVQPHLDLVEECLDTEEV